MIDEVTWEELIITRNHLIDISSKFLENKIERMLYNNLFPRIEKIYNNLLNH